MNLTLAIISTVLIFGAAVLFLSYIDKKKREKKLKEIKPVEAVENG